MGRTPAFQSSIHASYISELTGPVESSMMAQESAVFVPQCRSGGPALGRSFGPRMVENDAHG